MPIRSPVSILAAIVHCKVPDGEDNVQACLLNFEYCLRFIVGASLVETNRALYCIS